MSVKINQLQIENLKKIKTVSLDLTGDAMTIIGGRNASGKTSCLDAIAWSLGGDKFRPTNPDNTETKLPAKTKAVLSNGLIVERTGKNGTLKVTDPKGLRGNQSLLNSFVSQFALDLPSFLSASDGKKAEILLQIIGVGEQLVDIEAREKIAFAERGDVKRELTRLQGNKAALPFHEDLPAVTSNQDLLVQLEEAVTYNTDLQERFNLLDNRRTRHTEILDEIKQLQDSLSVHADQIASEEAALKDLMPKDVDSILTKIQENDVLQQDFRDNQEVEKANAEIKIVERQHRTYESDLQIARVEKKALLDTATLPLPGLTVENGILLYNLQPWDCMSGAEQLIVATAIVRQLQPECGFILIDKAEQFDLHQLHEFAKWAEEQDFQIIATRVSETDECTIIIEDGEIKK